MSHFGYVIANSEEEADQFVRDWINARPGDRKILEGWNLCFGREAEALALLANHKPYEASPQLWRFALALMPVDVPRETKERE